jgi:hypothetical protein
MQVDELGSLDAIVRKLITNTRIAQTSATMSVSERGP